MQYYNHTRRLLLNGDVDFTSLKVMLLNNHTFDATHTAMSSISGNEVHGNGWPEGGQTIANVAITTVDTFNAMIDGDDISVTADGSPIGPSNAFVVYDSANDNPLFYYTHSSTTAGDGFPYSITWDSNNGIARALSA